MTSVFSYVVIMEANISKFAEMNAANIKECKVKLLDLEKEMAVLVKESMLDSERYKRHWNLKIQGLKETNDKDTRSEVINILAKMAPQWTSSLDNAVDTVHHLEKREAGKQCQIMIQFTMRHHRDAFWKSTKESKTCKELGINFKQDLCE